MKFLFILLLALPLVPLCAARAADAMTSRPNVLFIIAVDASRHFGEAYGCTWVPGEAKLANGRQRDFALGGSGEDIAPTGRRGYEEGGWPVTDAF